MELELKACHICGKAITPKYRWGQHTCSECIERRQERTIVTCSVLVIAVIGVPFIALLFALLKLWMNSSP